MASSPHNQPLSISQYTNMLSSSPLKPSSYYFQHDMEPQNHNEIQDENFKPQEIHTLSTDITPQFLYHNSDNETELVVPVSQNNKHSQQLQYPPKYDNMPAQYNFHHQQAQQQQQQQHDQSQQTNLYPPMEFQQHLKPHTAPLERTATVIPESTSISSFDSVPFLTNSYMSSSVSDNSIASPISFQNTTLTPRRPTNRRTSISMTPIPHIYQTPAQQNHLSPIAHKSLTTPRQQQQHQQQRPRHRRTKSRLSLDANGAASIVTIHNSTSNNSLMRSPSMGTNPFYTPNTSFLSPSQGASPSMTPLATPAIRKDVSFSSISPNMLMSQPRSVRNEVEKSNQVNNFSMAADLTMKLASKFIDDSVESPNLLVDPLNSEIPKSASLSSSSSTGSFEQYQSTTSFTTQSNSFQTHPPQPQLSRSQSSINLAQIAGSNKIAPPEITRFDIMQPRKRIQKSQSTTNLNTNNNGKKPKKIHSCPLCNAIFQRPEHVKRHMRSHSSEKPFQCDEEGCGKRFNRGDNLKAHLRKIHKRNI